MITVIKYNVNHIALLFEEVNDKEIQLRNSLRDQGNFVLSAEFYLHSPKNISKNSYSG